MSAVTPTISSDIESDSHTSCYHCGLPVYDPDEFVLEIKSVKQSFCCPGCQAITSVIVDGGLEQFYQYRTAVNRRAEQQVENFNLYDRADIQQSFVTTSSDNPDHCTAYLLLDNITCAACVWLIEKRLGSIAGVSSVRVNAANHQCLLQWNAQTVSLSMLMQTLASIGYRPQPLTYDSQEQQRTRYQRLALMRLGVAAFGMMQVGMVAIALYAGALQGMDEHWVSLFRWISLIVATPVVLFAAQPFWSAAWRSLKQKHLTMEVPVSLAIILAYLASAWATFHGGGEVYFDSVSMFTFFLLIGRYLEMRTRYRNHQQTTANTRLLPMAVQRLSAQGQLELIPLSQLAVGDQVRVNSGETIPCDGTIAEGHSAVIEALLTGESEPVDKTIGDVVIAGNVNTEGSLLITALAVNQQTRLSTIEQLVNFAQQDKPAIQQLADKVASYFVLAVLIVASGVFTFWWFHEPESALWVTLSVLVVTCPCALSLATPTVLTATIAKMRGFGLLVLKGHVIESLTHIQRVIFDKTGTLTYGEPKVVNVTLLDSEQHEWTPEQLLAISAALEEGSSHPIAKAFAEYHTPGLSVVDRELVTGAGVKAVIDGQQWALGKPEFVTAKAFARPNDGQWLLLAEAAQPRAWIQLSDRLRDSAPATIAQLRQQAIDVEILSGDHISVVSHMAHQLGQLPWHAEVSPEQKLLHIQHHQQQQPVLMVGDGINDVPVLAGANVSVAMDSASDFARSHADTVLLNSDLTVLPAAIRLAHRCKRIIRQNLSWALGYNLLALPLAAAGLIPPYLAAIGMSLSSLIVVVNALRV